MRSLVKKIIQMVLYSDITNWKELEYISIWLKDIPRDQVLQIFEYGMYIDFMNFRSMFIEGVEKRDKNLILNAYKLFAEKLYPTAKQHLPKNPDIYKIRNQLVRSYTNV